MKYGIDKRGRLITTSDDERTIYSKAFPHTGYCVAPRAILECAAERLSLDTTGSNR